MSNYTELKTILAQAGHEITRRLYFKRRNPTYEAAWQQIESRRVVSWGSKTQAADKINPAQASNGQMSIVLDNRDGYFNDVSDANSFFNGASARYKTLVKVEFAYINADGNEIPDNPLFFIGTIGENITQGDDGLIKIGLDSLEEIFKSVPAENIDGLITSTYSYTPDLMRKIRDHTDGSGNYLFKEYLSNGSFKFHHNFMRYYLTAGVDLAGISAWELITSIAESDRQKLFVASDGNVVVSPKTYDLYYQDIVEASATSNILFHNRFDASLITGGSKIMASDVGPDAEWTGTSAFSASKFNEGMDGDQTNYVVIEATATAGFNLNRFTMECWITTNFAVSSGVAECQANIATWYNNNKGDYMRLGFGNGVTGGNYLGMQLETNIYPLGVGGTTTMQLIVDTATASWATGTTHFLAFVKDIDGIGDSTDIFRIYHAPDGGALSLVAAYTPASGYDVSLYNQMMAAANTTITFGDSPTATSTVIIDNVKIYDYARLTFDDWTLESSYARRESFEFRGLSDSYDSGLGTNIYKGIQVAAAHNKIYNKVNVNYGDFIYTKEETWSVGDASSSDMYGMRVYDMTNNFMDTLGATLVGDTIFYDYKDLKSEVTFTGKLNPWINILDKTKITYQSPVSSGTSRSINLNEAEYRLIKAQHDLDKMESKFTFREV